MENIISTISSNLVNVIIFLAIISSLVFIHELGHFLAARIVKAKVLEFGLGLGPKMFSKHFKGTLYRLNWLPFGGYVKILGEENDDKILDSGNLQNKTPIARIFVMLAGVFMNIVLAISLYYVLIPVSGYKIYLSEAASNVKPVLAQMYVEKIQEKVTYDALIDNGGAKAAGMPSSGTIDKIDGIKIEYSNQISGILSNKKEQKVEVSVCNEDKCKLYFPIVSSEGKLGISVVQNYVNVLSYEKNKLTSGIAHPINVLKISIVGLGNIFKQAKSTGDYSTAVNTVSGPIGIFVAIDNLKKYGLETMLFMVADLSLVLGVMNVLPIPALDGGRVLLILPELLFKKRINWKLELILINFTFILLFALMIVVAIKDVVYIKVLQSLFK
ncbi:site-2 protease family protein [Candidatus Dojkabacteria bacterium]|nr:site-2 protease family protein [Candidatus Dojkabacteria bacterium]